MADNDDYSDLLSGEPQRPSRADILYNALVPDYLKYKQPSEMPPPGTPERKIGPPSGMPTPMSIAGEALPDVLSWLTPGVKGAGLASKAIMAGPLARTANMKAYHDALGMVLGNKSREAINRMTGWYPRTEGQLAYEIPDASMMPKKLIDVPQGHKIAGPYEAFVHHPDAFAAYPELRGLNIEVGKEHGPEGSGMITDQGNKILIGGQARKSGLTPSQLGTLVHESQHAVQYAEGWPAVAGEDAHRKMLRKTLSNKLQSLPDEHPDRLEIYSVLQHLNKPQVRNSLEYDPAFNMYWHGPSEVEARNVTNRMLFGKYGVMQDPQGQFYQPKNLDMSRYHNPWTTEDVPISQQFNYWKHIKPPGYY